MAKALADSWRPQIGAHGIIVDGVGKFLFLADQDIGKGSDLQCTAMCCALEAESGLFSLSAAPQNIMVSLCSCSLQIILCLTRRF